MDAIIPPFAFVDKPERYARLGAASWAPDSAPIPAKWSKLVRGNNIQLVQ
jgi:hypothetical protein